MWFLLHFIYKCFLKLIFIRVTVLHCTSNSVFSAALAAMFCCTTCWFYRLLVSVSLVLNNTDFSTVESTFCIFSAILEIRDYNMSCLIPDFLCVFRNTMVTCHCGSRLCRREVWCRTRTFSSPWRIQTPSATGSQTTSRWELFLTLAWYGSYFSHLTHVRNQLSFSDYYKWNIMLASWSVGLYHFELPV